MKEMDGAISSKTATKQVLQKYLSKNVLLEITKPFDGEIKGIKGVACEKAARILKKLLGAPSADKKTKEYFVKPQIKKQIKK